MDNEEKYPTLKEVNAVRETHDRLTACSYNLHDGGMMYNSNSSDCISIRLENGEQIITQTVKLPFGESMTAVYRAAGDVLSRVKELVDRENMAAWSALRFRQQFFVTDVSHSEGIWLCFEDGEERQPVSRNINVQAVRQQGAGAVADEFHSLLSSALEGAELISGGINKPGTISGITVMPGTTSQPDPAAKGDVPEGVCPVCGASGNTGRFCCECGTRLREG